MIRVTVALFCVGFIGCTAACEGPSDVREDLFPGAHGVVRGTVSDQSSSSISGAEVQLQVYSEGCESGRFQGTTNSGQSGAYSFNVTLPNIGPFEACIELAVIAPQGSEVASTDTSGINMEFVGPDEVPDTINIDFILAPE